MLWPSKGCHRSFDMTNHQCSQKKVNDSPSRRSQTTSSPKSVMQPSGTYWPRKDIIDVLHARYLTLQIVLEYLGGKGGGMNSACYQEQVLDGVLRDFFVEMKSEKPQLKFQQDNAPSHRSKFTMKWFKESSIPLLFRPPSSANISPIEPGWHKLKKALWALLHLPTTIQELCAAILSVWDMLPIEDVDKHINRIHDCVEAILATKGGHTRF